ncbi:MAG: PQQ-binding-like beta-propeller repeat protein [Proteobacteria bacterium]|nr:PQQ-binding-like beta-propeller repeat protein [Pseudomonadota bacterium]
MLRRLTLFVVAACAVSAHADPARPAGGSSSLKDVSELSAVKSAVDPETLPGAPVYHRVCAHCHEGQVAKAPHKMFLQMMPAANILTALDTGLMKDQAAGLSAQERRQVAEYLGGSLAAAAGPAPPRCTAAAATFDLKRAPAALGWGLDASGFVPQAAGGLAAADLANLTLKWAFAFPGAIRARSQPAVGWGAVYVGSQDGTVYALDLANGCVRWTFQAPAEVRTAIVAAPGEPPRLYFGDVIAHAYAVDALTGHLLWSTKVDDHPNATVTGTPAYHDGTLYVPVSSLEVTSAADPHYECCKFRGSVVALDAATGTPRWKAYSVAQEPKLTRTTERGTKVFAPSGAPIWGSPTVDAARGLLYVGTGDNYSSPADDSSDAVIAFRLADGSRAWARQLTGRDAWNVACMMQANPNCPGENGPDVDVSAPIIPYRSPQGRELLLVGQKNGMVYGLDPDAGGKVVWEQRVSRGGIQGGVEFGMAREGSRLYVPIVDLADGHDGRHYDSAARPGLYALAASTGNPLWSAPAPQACGERKFCDGGILAAVTAIPGAVLAGHLDGWLRAYDAATGKVIWQYDANQAVKTVSGAQAHGGSFGGPGPVVRDGYLIATSGYGLYFHMPGNVMLVFGRN